MTSSSYAILDIKQTNNHSFTILWNDGVKQAFRLSDLQQSCPCARCVKSDSPPVLNEAVRAKRIVSVGRYALKIDFTSGCSTGIYEFDFLRQLPTSP